MANQNVSKIVAAVISDVRKRGDKALIDLARKFDRVKLTASTLRVKESDIKASVSKIPVENRKAIEACARRIQNFHWEERKRLPQSWTVTKDGVRLGQIYSPIKSVGIYVPGGRFSYPSTVLMTAIAARLAGVEKIVVVTPPARLSNEILAAASIAGVKEVYRVGGPGALAALALGTASIPKVDLIIGPGNALVTEAKRQLFGDVGIDLLAGPSELVVVADSSAQSAFVAADLAAQAEHDPDSKGILISLDRKLISEVKKKIGKALLKRCEFYYFPDLKRAAARANEFAGEHVQVMLRRPQEALDLLKNGGTFFLNNFSTAVMGDYWAGPSHVLPTGRSARFASGLSVMTFLRRSSLVEVSSSAFKRGYGSASKMAEIEGLVEHANSLKVRMNGDNQ
jgi:histidinol dehydrogenase